MLYRVPLSVVPGAASIRVTLHYQTIPPYYLRDRFSLLDKHLPPPQAQETVRLKFLADNLQVKCTPVENWVFNVKCATRGLNDKQGRACAPASRPNCAPPRTQCPTN